MVTSQRLTLAKYSKRIICYVPIGTRMFANQLESARANYSTIAFIPREDRERNAQNETYDKQVKHHLKYLFANTSSKDEDEIYPVTVSEIAAAQQKKGYIRDTLRINSSKVKTR